MCGIIGLFTHEVDPPSNAMSSVAPLNTAHHERRPPEGSPLVQGSANAELFEGLLMLQHRGQDSAGMVTYDGHRFCEHKDNGLVNDVFGAKTMKQLRGGVPTCPPWPCSNLL